MYLFRASASQKGLKGKKYETLSSSSKEIERDTYEGGRRPKVVQTGALVSYFFLSILFGLQRLSKITFCGPWTYLNIHLYSLV